jgi:hypothetical protein
MKGVIWKNGTVFFTGGSSQSQFFDVLKVGSDLYIAGTYGEGFNEATVWKNGSILYTIPSLGFDGGSQFNSLATNGTDVFAAGQRNYISGSFESYGIVYKNGVLFSQDLQNGNNSSTFHSIMVNGGNVYTTGYYSAAFSNPSATLGVNGIITLFNTPDGSYGFSIGKKNTDIYIGGSEFNTNNGIYMARLWKNGVNILPVPNTNSSIQSVYIQNGY